MIAPINLLAVLDALIDGQYVEADTLHEARAAAAEVVDAAKDVESTEERFGFTYNEKLERLATALARFEVMP